ncbi:MAG: tRNA (adenosine(37)-N6)-threonylcarbamoyltransferase complex ATPase subunit type 1 TsaE [Deltaproteobacteria bacterium]|nr:tRNA (adenosine(37)-N6)-threonylcarbamoyltransferase complex ATPase subunit type 1 TsaE [Deltaproteobacteria bacterium]MBW2593100.1 tRNA (adenosine(37)-N6)-threonylcarbamoyltransferase complex ATPase subunit type 1 TsaE [Deltaproteobacteria bacterium]
MNFKNNVLKYQVVSNSPKQTRALGRKIGQLLSDGSVLALRGDLGSGKTVFVQGLAEGLDVPGTCYVTSPTYTLINEYPGRLPLFHVDLYRLNEPLDMEEIGLYDILREKNVTAIEWAERLEGDLPREYLSLDFTIISDKSRKISILAHGADAGSILEKM